MAKQSGEKERFQVLVEQFQHEVQILADGLVAHDQKFNGFIKELSEQMNAGFARMDVGFDGVLSQIRSVAKQVQEHEHAK